VTIGELRSSKTLKTPGPGEYCPESAEKHTKARNQANNFSATESRKSLKYDSSNGPGTN